MNANFSVAALPQDVADYVRANGRDPVWGHASVTEPAATGFGPCRLCLRTFEIGREARTLFTHDTYTGVSEFPQPGPVYIHASGCDRYTGDGFPPDLLPLKLTFEAVASGPRIVALERTNDEQVEEALERLLALPDVDYVNVRNTEAGCFVARVERLKRRPTSDAARGGRRPVPASSPRTRRTGRPASNLDVHR